MTDKNTPFGQTQRLFFAKITFDDFGEISKMLNQSNVRKFWGKKFTNNDIKKWIENCINSYTNKGEGFYIIRHRQTGDTIGQISLSQDTINSKIYYEIGYILNEKYTGQGFATEAAKYMVKYAFKVLNLDTVIFEIQPKNTKSVNVAKRLGAKEQGSFIKKVNGKKIEHIIFEIKNNQKTTQNASKNKCR